MNNSINSQAMRTCKSTVNVPNNQYNFQSWFIEESKGQKSIDTSALLYVDNQGLMEREMKYEPSNHLETAIINQDLAQAEAIEDINNNDQLLNLRAKYLITEIKYLVEFIKEYIDSDFELNLKGTTTLRRLLQKQGELHALIMNQKPEIVLMHRHLMHHFVGPQLIKNVEENMDAFGGKDTARNTIFSFSVYREISLKYYEFSDERNKLLGLNLKQFDCDNGISGLDVFIKNAASDIREIINKKYYSSLCSLLDLNFNVYEKAKKLLIYLGMPKSEIDNLSSDDLFGTLSSSAFFSKISNAACYVVKLQILVDLLMELKNSPKTLENLKLLLEKCEDCFNYFEEDVSAYNEWCKGNDCFDSAFYQDYKNVKLYLKNLVDQLIKLKVEASWSTPISSGKNKGKENQRKKKKQIKTQVRQKTTKSQDQKKQEKIQIIPDESKVEELKMNSMSGEVLLIAQKEIAPEEDSLEDIERETNELFESIRQLIEKDRKAKLELKELKAAQKKNIGDDEDKIIIIEKKPQIIKLSSGHQLTLDAIFNEKDCHLKLSGSEIENLINALGGKTKSGSKKKINIFWGNSTKKAGSYEVTHGCDCDGCLTGGYVDRVKKAILVGIQIGCIAKESIPYAI